MLNFNNYLRTVYKVHVRKETIEGNFSTWMPFDNGNFNVTIGQGRKSQKKLNTIENYINNNSNLLKLILDKNIKGMCSRK